MTQIEQSLLSRLELPPEKRTPVHIFVDEAPLFISQSESAFTTILEQARKAAAVLTFVHQGLHQLPRNMAGALQNCLPLLLRAGSIDSSELASRFFRPVEEPEPHLFDLFSLPSHSYPLAFQGVKNTTQARMIFEQLKRQEAICVLPEGAVKFTTPSIPITINQKRLAVIEETYARKLLVPWSRGDDRQFKSGAVASPRLLLVFQSQPLQRRTYQPSTSGKPLVLFSGNLEQDIQTALSTFHYLTLDQLTRLLGKKEGNKNYLRKKLTDMSSTVSITLLPRVTGGKPLQVFHLTANSEKKQMFLEHTLDVNEVLIAGVLLPTVVEGLTLVDVKSERTLKTLLTHCPCIPDGLLSFQTKTGEIIHIGIECDRASENSQRIEQKLTSSSVWIETLGIDALTLAFIVTTGDKKRVSWLCDLANEVVTDLADILLFAAVSGDSITPSLFTDLVFKGLDNLPHALIEIREK